MRGLVGFMKCFKNITCVTSIVFILLLTGCGSGSNDTSWDIFATNDTSSAVSSDNSDDENGVSDLDENSDILDDDNVEELADSEDEDESSEVIPEDFSYYLLNNRNFTAGGFDQIASNDELSKCFDKLDKIVSEIGTSLAFSYKNIDTGAVVNYNENKQFMTCSTIKAPYIKSILANGIDLDDKIVKNKNWTGDTVGVDYLASKSMGDVFTAKELIELSIQISDNTAYYLLEQYYGWTVFNNLNYSIGANYYVGSDWIFTYATTSDMMKSFTDIYEFGEESENGKWLIDLMTETDNDEQISASLSDKYKVAHKYGSEFSESVYNDCAIVYADSPFVLCIYSNQYPETEQSDKVFNELADVFDEINSLIC